MSGVGPSTHDVFDFEELTGTMHRQRACTFRDARSFLPFTMIPGTWYSRHLIILLIVLSVQEEQCNEAIRLLRMLLGI